MCPDVEKTNCYPGGASGKESARQYRRQKRHSFDPWVRKIPWSREWQPIPIFLPGEFHGQRSLAGGSPWGHKELDMWARACTHTHTHTHTIIIHTLQDSSVAHSSGWSDGRRRYKFFLADKLKLIDGERTGWSWEQLSWMELACQLTPQVVQVSSGCWGKTLEWDFLESHLRQNLLFQLSKLNGPASLIPRRTLLLFSH